MSTLSPYLRADRNNQNIERPSPDRRDVDSQPGEDRGGGVEAHRPDYVVDKKTKTEPEVSTPTEEKEEEDPGDRPDYGFFHV